MKPRRKGAFSGSDYQGNVGGGILKRFIVTFDYNSQTMYLKPLPGPVADTGTFDRAGMWINVADGGFKIVDVTKGGAADSAGLPSGVVVTKVDDRVIASADALVAAVRSRAPGDKVTLTYTDASGAPKTVQVTLGKATQ